MESKKEGGGVELKMLEGILGQSRKNKIFIRFLKINYLISQI